MAKIDTTTIEGYSEMTLEQKIAALEGYEYEDNSAEVQRLKNANDKASKDAAEWKRKHNALLSEEEQKKQADAETMAALQEKVATLEKEKTIAGFKVKYIGMGYDEALAGETAEAMANGDTEKVFANQQVFLEAHDKALRKDTMSNTGRPGAGGTGSGATDYKKMAEDAMASGDKGAAAYYYRLSQQTQINND